jgi:polyphosphate kinase 2 (PPK2 family)
MPVTGLPCSQGVESCLSQFFLTVAREIMGKHSKKDHSKTSAVETKHTPDKNNQALAKLKNEDYERELFNLQTELVKLQDWVKGTGTRIVVLFEGRDAAGKGGVIKRITERVSPRVFRLVALPAPTEREKTQIYWQRYIAHLPAAGEVVIFDRSWYNRAGIILLKYWLDVSEEEQHKRFLARIEDPSKRWKLSPMDLESHRRWYDFSRARDAMLAATDTVTAPWYIVPSDDKKRARLNCIADLLSRIPYQEVPYKPPKLPGRQKPKGYVEPTMKHQVVAPRY